MKSIFSALFLVLDDSQYAYAEKFAPGSLFL